MPSFGESFGLRGLTAWLPGNTKKSEDKDTAESTINSEKRAKPGKLENITMSSDIVKGKTCEEALTALTTAMPESPIDSDEVDELADGLEATSLSATACSAADTLSHNHTAVGNEERVNGMDANPPGLINLKPDCQCCNSAYKTEFAVTNIMQEAGSFGPGSTEYFDAIANVYHYSASQVARGKFLGELINNLKEQEWLEFASNKEGGVKVLDYAAGTGILSHALAPHVTEILAIDKSCKMVQQYNEIVAKLINAKCEMRAVQGDMTSHLLSGKKLGIELPEGAFDGFDMVAMCLAVDFFTHEDILEYEKHEELVQALDVMINLIDANGTLLIIDVEKCDENCYPDADSHSPGSAQEGLKVTGHGSKDIIKALEKLGMEDIAVVGDQDFLFEAKNRSGADSPILRRKETYFVLKAKRGSLFEKKFSQRHEGFHRGNELSGIGDEGWIEGQSGLSKGI